MITSERGYSEHSPMRLGERNMGDVKGRKTVIDYFEDEDDASSCSCSSVSDSELEGKRKFIQSQLQALSGGSKVEFRSIGHYDPDKQGQQRPHEKSLQLNDDGGDYYSVTTTAVNNDNKEVVQSNDWDKQGREPPGSAWLQDSSTTATTATGRIMKKGKSEYQRVSTDQKNAMAVQQVVYSEIIGMLRVGARERPHKGLGCGVEISKFISKKCKHVMPALNRATHVAGFRKGLIGWLELKSKLKGEIVVQRNTKGGTVWLTTDAPESIRRKAEGHEKYASSMSDSPGHGTDTDSSIYEKMGGSSNTRASSLDRNHQRYDYGERGGTASRHDSTRLDKDYASYAGGKGSDVDRFRYLSRRSQSRGEHHYSSTSRRRHSNDIREDVSERNSGNDNLERYSRHKGGGGYYASLADDVNERHRSSDSRNRRRLSGSGNEDTDQCGGKTRNDFGEGSSGEHRRFSYSNHRGSSSRDTGYRQSERWEAAASGKDSLLPPPNSPPPPDRVISLIPPHIPPSQTTFSDVCHRQENLEGEGGSWELLSRPEEVKEQREDVTSTGTWSNQQQLLEQVPSRNVVQEDTSDFEKQLRSSELLQRQRTEEMNKGEQELSAKEKRQELQKADTTVATEEKQEEQLVVKKESVASSKMKDEKYHEQLLRQEEQQDSETESSSSSSIYNFYTSGDDIVISAYSHESKRPAEIVDRKILKKKGPPTGSGAKSPNEELQPPLHHGVGMDVDEHGSYDSSVRDDRPCDACSNPEPRYHDGRLDDIVYCDSCNVPVHQRCYRISEIPSGEWFCDVCACNIDPNEVTCGFCPVIGGAMKRCKGGEEEGWAHLSCAYFIDELDVETIDGIDYIGVNPPCTEKSSQSGGGCTTRPFNKKGNWKGKNRNNYSALLTRTFGLSDYPFSTQKCMVCKLDLQGLLICCQMLNCKAKFHASCAAHADTFDMGLDVSKNGSYKCLPVKCSRHARMDIVKVNESVESIVTTQLKRWATERFIVHFPRKGKEDLVGKLMYHSPVSRMFCLVSESRQVRWVEESKVIEALGYEIGGSSESPTLVMKKTSNSSSSEPTANLQCSAGASSAPASKRLVKSEGETDNDSNQTQPRTVLDLTTGGGGDVSAARAQLPSGQVEEKGESSGGHGVTTEHHHHDSGNEDNPAVSLVTASSTTTTSLPADMNEWRFQGRNNGHLIAGLSMATIIQKVEVKTKNGQPIYFVQPCMVSPALHLPTAVPLCDRFQFESEQPDCNSSVEVSSSNVVERPTSSSPVEDFLLSSTVGNSRDNKCGLLHDGQKLDNRDSTATNDGDKRNAHHVRFSSKVSKSIRDPRLSSHSTHRLPVSRTLSVDDPRVTAQPPKERTTGLGKK